ncbi:fatty acyl-AMP ligase [Mycobacteroides salmoniphilum]|uniref:fatty acyl-AMP ligase n=1 Tax=Mycobacteroides salmoniphilum TaxID=404941 RepID=UPI001064A069|nr:fatty acyl-AMP ligase [Mycobacteroides salmoniphilum]TDZ77577.1 Long-chain-fatty-acid--AMP ligase FadD32 [Mycobacteroides salmoniphilum]TDZ86240.1 Long-chain-fatty-acid--AMP ligase FadD32 [Mycobacteroides salmoniphilum]
MFNIDNPRSLVTALQANAASTTRGLTFIGDDRSEVLVPFAELLGDVARGAGALAAHGIAPGDRVALVVPDTREFVTGFLAIVWLGAIPVPLYPPTSLGKQDAYLDFLESVLSSSGSRGLIAPQWVDEVLNLSARFGAQVAAVVHTETVAAGGDYVDAAPRATDQVTFLQSTSGSTGKPKAVRVTDASLWANAHSFLTNLRCLEAQKYPTERLVSWLPLYHDMGLIGHFLSVVLFGLQATYLPTLAFLRDPGIWLDTVSRHRGTVSFAPNFAFALTVKKAAPPAAGEITWDFSSVRVFGCGAEPINAEVLDAFIEAYGPYGLKQEAVMPAYGMAEATLAIAFDSLASRFQRLPISGAAYRNEGLVVPAAVGDDVLTFVSCGKVLDDRHRVRIIDDAGRELAPGRVGDVQFHGPSVAAGYFENEEATRSAFSADGWLSTGDRGFIVDGNLYVTGRKKDILVVNGRNYDPQQVEWAVEDVPGIRKGNVVAFSVPGDVTEQVVIAAERSGKSEDDDNAAQITKIRRSVSDRTRLALADVVLLQPGQLPKTSSGKVQRSRTRDLYVQGALADSVVATRTHAHAVPITV